MIRVIICEGKTDVIFLGYYLRKVSDWEYSNKGPKHPNIKSDKFEQTVEWYKKGEEWLLICAAGGKDNIKAFYQQKIEEAIKQSNEIKRLAVVLDRDNNEIESMEKHVSSIFKPIITKIKNNQWIENKYEDGYHQKQTLETLLIVIPTEHQGALESLMLDSISENPYDAVIVKKSGEFVKEMRLSASEYIYNNRAELKAHLGVTWAIQYPEKVFSLIDEQIRSVAWEKSEVLRECFWCLKKI